MYCEYEMSIKILKFLIKMDLKKLLGNYWLFHLGINVLKVSKVERVQLRIPYHDKSERPGTDLTKGV